MSEQAFLVAEGGRYIPNPISSGFWSPNSVHGRVVAGLLSHEIERLHGHEDFVPARFTVDLYAQVPRSPLEVVTRIVKQSVRLKLVDAEVICEGRSVAYATGQFVRRTETPPGSVWTPDTWDAPHPDSLPPETNPHHVMWTNRPIKGNLGSLGPKQLWMREDRDLVEGAPLTPFVRVAGAADYLSPFAHMGPRGIKYINSDVTLYLHREPVGEWIGFEVVDHGATDGVTVGACRLYDLDGPIGFGGSAALAHRAPARARS